MTDAFVTFMLRDEAERIESPGDLRALLQAYDEVFLSWPQHYTALLNESGLSYAALAARTGLSRNTLRRWCTQKSAPRCRETYIRLGFGFAMTAEQTSRLLVRYGGYPPLYAKDLFDAVCIFLLGRGCTDFSAAQALYARCMEPEDGCVTADTAYTAGQLRTLTTQEEFMRFAAQNGALFHDAHPQLRQYLADRLRAKGFDAATGTVQSIHSMFADSGIPARFEKDISALMTRGVVPRREKLIALCVHLGLLCEEIDTMLSLAGMEPLCAKNRLECILIYALQQLQLTHPEISADNAAQLLAVTRSRQAQEQCRANMEQYTKSCCRSEPDEVQSVVEYLRALLQELSEEEAAELLSII